MTEPGPRFIGKLWLTPTGQTRRGRNVYRLVLPFGYVDRRGFGRAYPAGMESDLASVPRAFWRIVPPGGPWDAAVVVHDGDCRFRHTTSARSHRDMWDSLGILPVARWQRWMIATIVQSFGPRWTDADMGPLPHIDLEDALDDVLHAATSAEMDLREAVNCVVPGVGQGSD